MTGSGEQAAIIRVMPEGFLFPSRQDLWVPLRMNAFEIPRNEGTWLSVFGPLAPGRDAEAASTELTGSRPNIRRRTAE